MYWLLRIGDYERPWVGRVGLALVVVLWLFVTVVGFAADLGTGLAFLTLGGVLIVGEVWIERDGEGHPRFVAIWRLSWRIGLGVAVIVLGAVRSSGWVTAVAVIFGVWLILEGIVLASLRWRRPGVAAAERDR